VQVKTVLISSCGRHRRQHRKLKPGTHYPYSWPANTGSVDRCPWTQVVCTRL